MRKSLQTFLGPGAWEWERWQKDWLAKSLRKDLNVFTLYLSMFLLLVAFQTDDRILFEHAEASVGRVLLTLFLNFLAVLTVFINVFHRSAPAKSDNTYHLIEDSVTGDFSFLTFNILNLQVIYWALNFLSELFHLIGLTKGMSIVRQLFIFCHKATVFNATLGIILGILFLRLCYFEEKWRKTVLEPQIARGNPMAGARSLFTHLNQMPAAFLDILFVKDRSVLRETSLSISDLSLVILSFAMFYFANLKINHAFSGRVPYPILLKIIGKPKREAAFVGAVCAFTISCSLIAHVLSKNVIHFLET